MDRRGNWILLGVGLVLLVLGGYLLLNNLAGGLASDWAYEMTGLRDAQDRGLSGQGVRVAIVDTGINPSHPSLDHLSIVAWKDYVNGQPQPYDDAGHGSHVAGILAGEGATFGGKYQGFNMKGAAPGVELVVVKAITSEGTGSSSNVAAGIDFSAQQGADIICLSLGSRSQILNLGDEITQSVNRAIDRGILVVAAAGNTGEESDRRDVESPASILEVIAVGAVDEDRRVADFSARGSEDQNYGSFPLPATRSDPHKKPETVAPGVVIQSAWTGDNYVRASGTSQAAPFVCGGLALLLEAQPALKGTNTDQLTRQVKNALMNSAEPLAGQRTPHDPRAGYGLFRADSLLNAMNS